MWMLLQIGLIYLGTRISIGKREMGLLGMSVKGGLGGLIIGAWLREGYEVWLKEGGVSKANQNLQKFIYSFGFFSIILLVVGGNPFVPLLSSCVPIFILLQLVGLDYSNSNIVKILIGLVLAIFAAFLTHYAEDGGTIAYLMGIFLFSSNEGTTQSTPKRKDEEEYDIAFYDVYIIARLTLESNKPIVKAFLLANLLWSFSQADALSDIVNTLIGNSDANILWILSLGFAILLGSLSQKKLFSLSLPSFVAPALIVLFNPSLLPIVVLSGAASFLLPFDMKHSVAIPSLFFLSFILL